MNKIVIVRFLSFLFLLTFSLHAYSNDVNKLNKKAKGIEKKADNKFIEQNFDKAMEIYESAFKVKMTKGYCAALHLKTARLYLTLLDYSEAIPHYEKAMVLGGEKLFTSVDICSYLDALRYSGDKVKAIQLARDYAYRNIYDQDQRYLNILHALDFEEGFLPVGAPEYTIEKVDKINTAYSEFWVGKMPTENKPEYFFATSNSTFHDPSKKFYHRTKYYSLDKNSKYFFDSEIVTDDKGRQVNRSEELLHMIPVDLQNGPLSFSEDMTKMIVTSVAYDKGEQIEITSKGVNAFNTKLFFSEYSYSRRGWSSFKLAFPQNKEASYAHPFMFNNDRSVLFSSNMEGGYGGYDIYIVHWDEKMKSWGNPINFGPQINTEGDEITPALFGDMLTFSSNGLVGFGGYDVYGISYEKGELVKGSLMHFDYPVNSVLNDFSMLMIDKDRGYIVSDRYRVTKDDVFYFERNSVQGKSNLVFGMSEASAISSGAIGLTRNEGIFSTPVHEFIPSNYMGGVNNANNSNTYYKGKDDPAVKDGTLLNVYFDFDQSVLTSTSINELRTWLASVDISKVDRLVIDGYADEIGGEAYNKNLSKKRAQVIAAWLAKEGVKIQAQVNGKGQIFLAGNNDVKSEESVKRMPSSGFQNESSGNSYSVMLSHKIWLNRESRRVDIKAILKK